jgi:hypothetical protein
LVEVGDVNTTSSTALAFTGITATGLQLPESMSREEWFDFGAQIGRIGGAIQWCLGDYCSYGEDREWANAREIAEQIGVHSGTIHNYTSVARAFPFSCRHENLTFTHHQAATAAPAEQRQHWLGCAEKNVWSVSRLRAQIRQAAAAEIKQAAATVTNRTDEEELSGTEPDQAATPVAPTIPAKTEQSTKKDLLAAWDESPENREIIRDIVLEEFFAQANAGDVLNYMPADRHDGFVRDLLDKFGVSRTCKAISPEFRKEWQEQGEAPRKRKREVRKSDKSEKKRFRKSFSMQRTTDASGKTVHALQQRGNRSRH